MAITVEQLVAETKRVFSFLSERGFHLSNHELSFPESFKGGFVLTFGNAEEKFVVQYLEMELEIVRGRIELFGPRNHPEFAGNMFSREHLSENIGRIGQLIARELRDPA